MKQPIIKFSLVILMSLAFQIVALTLLPQSEITVRAAGDRYVATTGTDSSNDCSNNATPCATIQHAVDVAASGDVIKIATGVYTGVNNYGGLSQVVYISKTVTLRGGYATAFVDPPDPAANPTTLDAQSQGRVIYVTGDISPTIEGLRITGGNASGLGGAFGGSDGGGGSYVISATVTFENNHLHSNTAENGGGIFLLNSVAIITGNLVATNTAGSGGGLLIYNSPQLVNDQLIWTAPATLSNNIVISNTAGEGGGILLTYSDAIFSSNTVVDNHAVFGGGVFIGQSSATFELNDIINNYATQGGGGLFSGFFDRTLLKSNKIQGNIADEGGGGLDLVGSKAKFDGNEILTNSALGIGGGGLFIDQNSQPIFVNNIIGNNDSQGPGSGLYVRGSFPQLFHTTIVNNLSGDNSGIYVIEFSQGFPDPNVYSSIMLTNTILVDYAVGISVVTGNTATLESTLWNGNTQNWTGAGVIVTGSNNYFGNPAFIDSASGDYHLGLTSAALNKGVNAGITTDIDGESRDSSPDLGADENLSVVPSAENSYLPIILK